MPTCMGFLPPLAVLGPSAARRVALNWSEKRARADL